MSEHSDKRIAGDALQAQRNVLAALEKLALNSSQPKTLNVLDHTYGNYPKVALPLFLKVVHGNHNPAARARALKYAVDYDGHHLKEPLFLSKLAFAISRKQGKRDAAAALEKLMDKPHVIAGFLLADAGLNQKTIDQHTQAAIERRKKKVVDEINHEARLDAEGTFGSV